MKNIGGYILIDGKGLNLASQSSQTIAGIYSALQSALTAKKTVILENCVYGSGKKLSPVQLFVYQKNSTTIEAFAAALTIDVSNANAVTVS